MGHGAPAARALRLLGRADKAYLDQIMVGVREPGRYANWIAPPTMGLAGRGLDFEYVRA